MNGPGVLEPGGLFCIPARPLMLRGSGLGHLLPSLILICEVRQKALAHPQDSCKKEVIMEVKCPARNTTHNQQTADTTCPLPQVS